MLLSESPIVAGGKNSSRDGNLQWRHLGFASLASTAAGWRAAGRLDAAQSWPPGFPISGGNRLVLRLPLLPLVAKELAGRGARATSAPPSMEPAADWCCIETRRFDDSAVMEMCDVRRGLERAS